jgi:release factor glutamine methyltransferase
MDINSLINIVTKKMRDSSISSPYSIARIIIADELNLKKEELILNENTELTEVQVNNIKEKANRICENIPLQYVINKQEFMKINFFVNENVLVPRQDTECLVEEALMLMQNKKELRVLDLCTGSGAVAISLAVYRKDCSVLASDISSKALEVAKINANKNNVENIELIESNMFQNINEKFDIIISNPPYIEKEEIKKLSKEVQKEPIIALDGGIDGLDFYRIISENAYKYLNPNGVLCMEIGYNQKQKVTELLNKTGKYKNIYSKKDLGGNDRIIVAGINEE